MKTRLEWLNEAEEQGYPWVEAAKAYCNKHHTLLNEVSSLKDALWTGFVFKDTEEQHGYWWGVLRSLDPEESPASTGNILDIDSNEPIHDWFELSYAQYLTVPRSVLQSMSHDWQVKFVELLEELDETIDWRPNSGRYYVKLRDENGRYKADLFADYDRGRRRIPHIKHKYANDTTD